MEFIDRVSAYPNRYLLTDENGNAYYVVLERADEPTRVGTPLNAETFNAVLASLLPAIEDTDYPGCYYRMVDGIKEWINPPNIAGVEYRLTERYSGMPMYTKRLTFTWNGYTELGYEGFADSKAVIRRYSCTSNNKLLPFLKPYEIDGSGVPNVTIDLANSAWVTVRFSPTNNNQLYISMYGTAVQGERASCQIWYTKG